jgi:hypothetical protein
MQGNIRDFSLAEMLQFIALGRRTGTLEIQTNQERYRIYTHNGGIVGVNAANVSLVKMLGEANLVPAEQLDVALRESQREGRDIGVLLVRSGLLTPADWQRFVQRELERLLYSLFSLAEAAFTFSAGSPQSLPPLALELPVDRVVLHGLRWAEEWGSLRPTIPSVLSTYGPAAMQRLPSSPELRPLDWRVLQCLDRPLDVYHLALRSGLSLLETGQSLARLAGAGYARLVTAGQPVR